MNSGRDTARRTWNSMRLGTIGTVDDSGVVQTAQVQLSYLETFGARPVVQQFGLASNPPVGADAVLLSLNGDPSSGVVVGTNHQKYRPTGQQSGEMTIYNAFGMSVYLSQGGIMIQANGQPVLLTGDLHVTGEVIRGFGGADQVSLGGHRHGEGSAAAGTTPPSPGT